jgi:hypothetical protein
MPHKTNDYKSAMSYFDFNQYGECRIHSSLLGTLKFWFLGANSPLGATQIDAELLVARPVNGRVMK